MVESRVGGSWVREMAGMGRSPWAIYASRGLPTWPCPLQSPVRLRHGSIPGMEGAASSS